MPEASPIRRARSCFWKVLVAFILGMSTNYALWYATTHFWPTGREEMGRIPSPDGALDAVLVELNPGAFSSYIYHVYIVPHGEPVVEGKDWAVFDAKHLSGVELSWRNRRLLEIRYDNAHIRFFCNLWISQRPGYLVEIRLGPRSDDFVTPELQQLQRADEH